MFSRGIHAAFRLLCVSALLHACSAGPWGGSGGSLTRLQGAGASFPAPLYMKWFRDFSSQRDGVQVDYQSVGSGSGVKSLIDRTVDFAASDAAMTPEEMAQVPEGVVLLPMTAGKIVLAYNLEGIAGLRLSRAAYAGIFLGAITRWNDPAIVASNPEASLPDAPINVVVRADSSGTSYVFTQHLSAISPAFAAGPGASKSPNWPVGTRAKGNEGITASLMTTPGSIGYVEYGYATGQKLSVALLENHAGAYVAPTPATGRAALSSVALPDDLVAWLPDPDGADSYPIVSYTWLITYGKYSDPAKAALLRALVEYCVESGQTDSEALGYLPLPAETIARVKAAATGIQ